MKIGMLERYPYMPLFCLPIIGALIAGVASILYALNFIGESHHAQSNTLYEVTYKKSKYHDTETTYAKKSSPFWGYLIIALFVIAGYTGVSFGLFTIYVFNSPLGNLLIINLLGALTIFPYYRSVILRNTDKGQLKTGYSWHFLALIPLSLYLAYSILTDGSQYGIEHYRGWEFLFLPMAGMLFFGLLAPLSISVTLIANYYRSLYAEQGISGVFKFKNNIGLYCALLLMIFLINQNHIGVDFFTDESDRAANDFIDIISGGHTYKDAGVFAVIAFVLTVSGLQAVKSLHKGVWQQSVLSKLFRLASVVVFVCAVGLPAAFLIAHHSGGSDWAFEFVKQWTSEVKAFHLDYDSADYYIWDHDAYYPFTSAVAKILGLAIIGYIALALLLSNTWRNHSLLLSTYCGAFLLSTVAVTATVEHAALPLAYDRFADVERAKVLIAEGKSVYEIYCKETAEHDRRFILHRSFTVTDLDTGKVVDHTIYVKHNKKGKRFLITAEGFKPKEVKDIDPSTPNTIPWYVTLERDH